MSQMKYRVYDKQNERMLYSHEPEEQGKREYYPLVFDVGWSGWEQEWFSEPMQYVPMKDEGGTDLYEDDLLSYTNWNEEKSLFQVMISEYTHEVDGVGFPYYGVHLVCVVGTPRSLYGPGYASSGLDYIASTDMTCVGNVWENPELLKGGQQ